MFCITCRILLRYSRHFIHLQQNKNSKLRFTLAVIFYYISSIFIGFSSSEIDQLMDFCRNYTHSLSQSIFPLEGIVSWNPGSDRQGWSLTPHLQEQLEIISYQ